MKNIKSLSEAGKQAKREYQKRWRKSNPDKIRQYQINYWEKKAQSQDPAPVPPPAPREPGSREQLELFETNLNPWKL